MNVEAAEVSGMLLAARGGIAAAVRGVRPVCFAMVMATAVVAFWVSGWQLGTAAGSRPVRGIGAVAIWPAVTAWTVTVAAMAASPLRRLRHRMRRAGSPRRTRANVPARRFKYQAMVTLLPSEGGEPAAALPSPECRMIVRAWPGHTHHTDIFSALVATSCEPPPDSRHQLVTITVSGCEAGDCLDPGEHVTLWRGRDIADAVVTRRIFT